MPRGSEDMQMNVGHEVFVVKQLDGTLRFVAQSPDKAMVFDLTDELKQQFAEPH